MINNLEIILFATNSIRFINSTGNKRTAVNSVSQISHKARTVDRSSCFFDYSSSICHVAPICTPRRAGCYNLRDDFDLRASFSRIQARDPTKTHPYSTRKDHQVNGLCYTIITLIPRWTYPW